MKIFKNYKAKSISYDSKKVRNKAACVKYIVIHNTGVKGRDTAENNAKYFATNNTREAGAHFFIDLDGKIYKSINMNRTAWSVGGDQRSGTSGEAKFYGKCTNYNSVSIELCGIVDNEPTPEMIKALKYLIKYIRKYCPNATEVIRHFDVNGKKCPMRYSGNSKTKEGKAWTKLLKEIGEK